MEVETSLNALMYTLTRVYSADSFISPHNDFSPIRKATRDATITVFDTNIAGLSNILKQVNSSITTLAVSVCRARNSLCDINRLPVEILHAIFHFVSEPDQEPFAEHTTENRLPTYHCPLRLSHICSHWRTIALEQRTLWSRLDITTMSKACIQLFQQRSGDCPLSIACPVWYKVRWREFWTESTARHRMKAMELSLPPLGVYDNLFSRPNLSSAPLLEKLYLSNFGAPMPLPHVFPGGTPCLQQLHVKGYEIEWRSGLYKNLTTLCLQDYRYSHRLAIAHLDDVLQMISDSPNLEELEYSLLAYRHQQISTETSGDILEFLDSFPAIIDNNNNNTSRISLHHLRGLHLVMPSSQSAAYLLNSISYSMSIRSVDVNIWGLCNLADLLHPAIISPCLFQSVNDVVFDGTPRNFGSYSVTSSFTAVRLPGPRSSGSTAAIRWSSDRSFHEETAEVADLLSSGYSTFLVQPQAIELGPSTPWPLTLKSQFSADKYDGRILRDEYGRAVYDT